MFFPTTGMRRKDTEIHHRGTAGSTPVRSEAMVNTRIPGCARLPPSLLSFSPPAQPSRPGMTWSSVTRWSMTEAGRRLRAAAWSFDDDRIVAVGDIGSARGAIDIDAGGKAVAPGFINMLSWATE